MKHYCTYFDTHYMLRGLTLYRSLQEHAGDFTLWVLCCDDLTLKSLCHLDLPNLKPVRLDEVEAFEPRLAIAKSNRTHVEYLWTLSPIWPLYLFDRDRKIDFLTYLDADLFLYSSPQPVFDEMGDDSIAMFAHRFPDKLKYMEVNGIYNVGWLSFRRDDNALGCLHEWREQCLDWCYDRCEDGKYGDQNYLNNWQRDHQGVRVLEHEGAGVAPWNWTSYHFSRRRNAQGHEQLYSNDAPLIFFHFHGIRFLNTWLYDAFYSSYHLGEMSSKLRHQIFGPYLRSMIATARWARGKGCQIEWGRTSFKRYMNDYGKRLLINKVTKRGFAIHMGLK